MNIDELARKELELHFKTGLLKEPLKKGLIKLSTLE